MRGFLLGVVVTILVVAVGGYFLVGSGLIPANADAKPGGVELWIADTALDAALKRNAPTTPNPVPLTDANLAAGAKLFGDHCAVCHGGPGGEADISPFAKGLYPAPPQFATDGVEDDPEGYSYWKIKHGIRLTGMPSWKDVLDDRQIWTLALFLKHMDKLPPTAEAAWKQVTP
jgi:thiosulfate dehydrogenase